MSLLLLLNPKQGSSSATTAHTLGGYFPAVFDNSEPKKRKARKKKRKAYEVSGVSTEAAEAIPFVTAPIEGFVTELATVKKELRAIEEDDEETLLRLLKFL